MIFLLFLVSVAVLEYVVRRPEGAGGGSSRPGTKEHTDSKRPADPVPASTGLHTLGDALDQYGRGQTPGTAGEVPQSPSTTENRI